MPPCDEIAEKLARLRVPDARSNAVYQIVQAAKANPPKQPSAVASLKRLRAQLYVPQMRYVVMASIVALLITIGVSNRALNPDTPNTQFASDIPDELLLYDIEFSEFEPEDLLLGNGAG